MMDCFSIPFLRLNECAGIVEKIDSLSAYYHPVRDGIFNILGAASYQFKNNNQAYYQKAAELNPILWTNFQDIYRGLLIKLGYFLQAPVGYWEHTGLPGFHVIEVGKQVNYYGGSRHFDLSYRQLLPFVQGCLPHFSFTLSLVQPAGGAGLNIWDLHYNTVFNTAPVLDPENEIQKLTPMSVSYVPGTLAIFDGHYFHQIAPLHKTLPGDRRITLQGHCVLIQGGWAVYW